jgi:tetratricopeptide (TPR) repeat protein
MKRSWPLYWMLAVMTHILFFSTARLCAQDQPPESSSKPPEAPNPPKKADKKNKPDGATQNSPDQPTWDPLRAEKDLEVGQYYMRKGDVDAAIDRFQDATTAKPGYAVPFRYLGEAQEKKGLKKQAVKSYSRYLELYPHAEDGDKIRKKIDKLRADVEKKKKRDNL